MDEINQNAPNSKLLPHMIEDHEVSAMVDNDDKAEKSLARRLDAAEDRKSKNELTKFIATTAAIGAVVVGFVVRHHEINKDQAKITDPYSHSEPGPPGRLP